MLLGTMNRCLSGRVVLGMAAGVVLLAACGKDSQLVGIGNVPTASTERPSARASASSSAPEPSESASAAAGSSSPAASEPSRRPGAPDAVELDMDLASAVEVVDTYWSTHWSDFFEGTYTAPTVLGLYDGSQPDAPTCSGEPLVADNAFYCIKEDYVSWDVSLMLKGLEFGDSWVYLIVAHEWGHAIAHRLNTDLQAQEGELQADCIAGAVLYGSKKDGVLEFEEGDEKELARSLSEIGDETPWTSSSDHGDPFERIGAFSRGRDSGVLACLPDQADS